MNMQTLLLEGSTEILMLLDVQTLAIVAASSAAHKQLGYEESELVGLPIGSIECALSDLFFWEEMAASAIPLEAQSSYQRRDGAVLELRKFVRRAGAQNEFYLLRARPARKQHIEPEVDITGVHLAATLEATVDGILLIDNDGAILNMNRRFSSLMQLPERLLAERDDHGIVAYIESLLQKDPGSSDAPTALSQAIDLKLDLGGDTFEKLQLADGRVVECASHPARSRERTIGRVFCYRDITERVEYEHYLQEARDIAEKATISKGQFLANMSHEIRTPMNAILGMLKLMHGTSLNPRQFDYINKAEGAAKSLLGLLNDILDYSKADAGKMTLECEPLRIDKLLRSLAVVLSANVGAKNMEVLFDIDPSLPPLVKGDALRLQQVLTNLGGNAVKFTAEGQVVLALRNQGQTAQSVTIEFAVSDTGIGIAPENQAHIFSGFSQAEATTTRRFGGTGLGLAISKRLVELMGGDIRIQSSLGQGSTFSFVIDMPVVGLVPPDLIEPARQPLPAQRVLVVDDNPIAAELALQMVRSWGWTADLAGTGAQALALVSAAAAAHPSGFPYPVIYLDWKLPDTDGWSLMHQLRQQARIAGQAQPTIIMVTAHGRDVLAQRTPQEQEQLSGFLVKPITASMLYDAVADAITGKTRLRDLTKGRSSARQLSGMRILVVEDNLINQQVADELLSAAGAIVSLAANGQIGVDAVAAAAVQFDVVLMDLQMPVLDGYGATRKIREELGLTQLPIIAMTANAMASDREACLAAGMNEHIGKPFDIDRLVGLLLRMTTFQPEGRPAIERRAVPPADLAQPTVPGIDIATALERMSGLRALYVRTAREFVKILPSVVAELQQQLSAGDRKLVTMLLHTLKGNAGTLGVTELAAVSAKLEVLCKTDGGLTEVAHSMAPFATLLERSAHLLQQAIQLLDAPPVPLAPAGSAGAAADPAAAMAALAQPGARAAAIGLLQKIESLSEASNLEALQFFDEERAVLASLPADFVAQLDDTLKSLDLPQARALCARMLAQL